MDHKKTVLNGTLPWTKSCFVCGVDNRHGLHLKTRLEKGTVVIEHRINEENLGWKTTLHGGITMTLLDEAMTWAAIVESGHACVSAEITVRMKKPMSVGEVIRVEACVASNQRRILLTEAEMKLPDGTVTATATGKYVPMKGGQYDICAADFVSSPSSIAPTDIITTPAQ